MDRSVGGSQSVSRNHNDVQLATPSCTVTGPRRISTRELFQPTLFLNISHVSTLIAVLYERMTIDHFWDSIVTIGNLPIRKSGAMTSILRDAMKGMNDNHDEP